MEVRDIFFGKLHEVMAVNNNIVILTADMNAHKLEDIKRDYPDRFYNVGIAEQLMVNVAAGLALSGKIVFCFTIASFLLRRAYEQIKLNIVGMDLPVGLIGFRGGNYYWYDGESHCCSEHLQLADALGIKHQIVNTEDETIIAISHVVDQKKPLYIALGAINDG